MQPAAPTTTECARRVGGWMYVRQRIVSSTRQEDISCTQHRVGVHATYCDLFISSRQRPAALFGFPFSFHYYLRASYV